MPPRRFALSIGLALLSRFAVAAEVECATDISCFQRGWQAVRQARAAVKDKKWTEAAAQRTLAAQYFHRGETFRPATAKGKTCDEDEQACSNVDQAEAESAHEAVRTLSGQISRGRRPIQWVVTASQKNLIPTGEGQKDNPSVPTPNFGPGGGLPFIGGGNYGAGVTLTPGMGGGG